jgi:hypothetical protein
MALQFLTLVIWLSSFHSLEPTSKLDLLCHNWTRIGGTSNGGKFFRNNMHGKLILNKDLTFRKEEEVYGIYVYQGSWNFNSDSTSIKLQTDQFSVGKTKSKRNEVEENKIVKLSNDTLVLHLDQGINQQFEVYYIRNN